MKFFNRSEKENGSEELSDKKAEVAEEKSGDSWVKRQLDNIFGFGKRAGESSLVELTQIAGSGDPELDELRYQVLLQMVKSAFPPCRLAARPSCE